MGMKVNARPGDYPQRKASEIGIVSADMMRSIERAALEDYGLDVLQLMENAGRSAASLALAMLGGRARGQRIVVIAGSGAMGGTGFAAVRHLSNTGIVTEPILGFVDEEELPPASRRQLHILRRSGIAEPHSDESSQVTLEEHIEQADLVIDALAGYGVEGPLPGLAAAIVETVAASGTPVLALDGPSGMNCTTGERWSPGITAVTTLAFDRPKPAMVTREAAEIVGSLYVADVGIPARVHGRLGLDADGLFAEGPIVRVRI